MEEPDYDKLREMISRCEWTFAKTMPFAPRLEKTRRDMNYNWNAERVL